MRSAVSHPGEKCLLKEPVMESKKQKIILELKPLDVQRIALDDDRDRILRFLKKCLDKKE